MQANGSADNGIERHAGGEVERAHADAEPVGERLAAELDVARAAVEKLRSQLQAVIVGRNDVIEPVLAFRISSPRHPRAPRAVLPITSS